MTRKLTFLLTAILALTVCTSFKPCRTLQFPTLVSCIKNEGDSILFVGLADGSIYKFENDRLSLFLQKKKEGILVYDIMRYNDSLYLVMRRDNGITVYKENTTTDSLYYLYSIAFDGKSNNYSVYWLYNIGDSLYARNSETSKKYLAFNKSQMRKNLVLNDSMSVDNANVDSISAQGRICSKSKPYEDHQFVFVWNTESVTRKTKNDSVIFRFSPNIKKNKSLLADHHNDYKHLCENDDIGFYGYTKWQDSIIIYAGYDNVYFFSLNGQNTYNNSSVSWTDTIYNGELTSIAKSEKYEWAYNKNILVGRRCSFGERWKAIFSIPLDKKNTTGILNLKYHAGSLYIGTNVGLAKLENPDIPEERNILWIDYPNMGEVINEFKSNGDSLFFAVLNDERKYHVNFDTAVPYTSSSVTANSNSDNNINKWLLLIIIIIGLTGLKIDHFLKKNNSRNTSGTKPNENTVGQPERNPKCTTDTGTTTIEEPVVENQATEKTNESKQADKKLENADGNETTEESIKKDKKMHPWKWDKESLMRNVNKLDRNLRKACKKQDAEDVIVKVCVEFCENYGKPYLIESATDNSTKKIRTCLCICARLLEKEVDNNNIKIDNVRLEKAKQISKQISKKGKDGKDGEEERFNHLLLKLCSYSNDDSLEINIECIKSRFVNHGKADRIGKTVSEIKAELTPQWPELFPESAKSKKTYRRNLKP